MPSGFEPGPQRALRLAHKCVAHQAMTETAYICLRYYTIIHCPHTDIFVVMFLVHQLCATRTEYQCG